MSTEAEHFAQMHPFLAERLVRVLESWRTQADAGDTIRVTESVRSLGTQQAYYAKGASKADGIHKFSLHQFAPACAADCLVIRGGKVVSNIADPAWEAYGALAEQHGLEWGGRWDTLRDGPHVQIPLAERVKLVQAAVGVAVDGAWGPATTKAVAARVALREGHSGWDALTPAAWSALVGA